jgi:hypothetical protein
VAEILANRKTKQVTQVRVSTLDGHKFFVKAQLFIWQRVELKTLAYSWRQKETQKEGLGNQ